MRLLELMAYVSEAIEDMLDMDIVSNFISAAMLLKELDSIIVDIIACWAEDEEKEEDSSTCRISFFIIIDELVEDDNDDSWWVIIADPADETDGKRIINDNTVTVLNYLKSRKEEEMNHSNECMWIFKTVHL